MNQKLRGKRIFIAEDNSANRVVYTIILKLSGVIFDFDRFGKDAVFKLQGFMPDLIVLDLMLSHGTSGYEIFEEIRAVPELSTIPIVAISASEPSYAVPKCRELGFAGFIAKPIEEDLLVDQLARLIEGEQVWYLGERYGGEIKEDKEA